MQIANQFRTDILAGKYAQGEYLPSIHLIFGAGMLLEIGLHFFIPKGFIHPLVAIVADIVLVLTGGVIQYGLMKLFYKFPLSKVAFGAAIKREMNA